jgi:hypothetical protein
MYPFPGRTSLGQRRLWIILRFSFWTFFLKDTKKVKAELKSPGNFLGHQLISDAVLGISRHLKDLKRRIAG